VLEEPAAADGQAVLLEGAVMVADGEAAVEGATAAAVLDKHLFWPLRILACSKIIIVLLDGQYK
jgi:hypothetical protein